MNQLDPYLFVFLFIGGGLVCLIAVVVTNNKLVTEYENAEKYTEDPIIFPPRP
jgi:hypothetical protein